MERYASSLIGQYRSAGVLVDTNLLLLLFIGAYDKRQVERFPRTADRFVAEDYDTLAGLLRQFDAIVTTPHVLTETSNLIGRSSGRVRQGVFEVFASFVSQAMREQHTTAADLVQGTDFFRFGIADAAISRTAGTLGYLVLTDDFVLYGLLAGRGVDVLNFNQIRGLTYDP